MIAQLVLSVALFFFLLIAMMLFYLRYQSKVPYYRMSQEDCVDLLTQAVQGNLLEQDWDVFVSMNVRDNRQIEELRAKCHLIDETYRKGTTRVDGKKCVLFQSKGKEQLADLLDEWKHKESVTV